MKINRIIIAAIAAAAAVSCQKEASFESGNQMLEPMTISTEAQTKTSLNGSEIHWTSDDVIAVFDNTGAKNEFTLTMAEGSAADFTGNVTAGTTQIYAVYPYELAKSAEGAVLNVTLPADQTSKAGSFAEEHNISVAKAEKTPGVAQVSGVSFKNACALLKFTVPAYLTDVQKVTVSSNTVIAGDMTIDYSGDAPVCTVSENGSKSISMTGVYETGSTFWFVLAPVTLDGITVKVETAKGVYSMSTANQFEMTAGQYRNLGTLNLEKASMLGASAAHTYADGILTGTDVTVSLGLPETTAAYITSLTLQVKNAEGTVVRTFSKNGASATEVISADAQRPYLPKGEYTVSGSYTLSGVETKDLAETAFTVSAPEFTVAPGAYSSYTKYLDGKTSEANACQAETIYNLSTAVIGISDNILNNANYSALTSQVTFTLDGNATTEGSASGQAWGSHTVTASYTFDGETAVGSINVDITGLPYSHTFYNNEANTTSTWTCSNIQYTISKCALFYDGTYGNMFSPKFNIPASGVNISYTIGARFYMPKTFNASKETCELYVGAASGTSTPVTTNSHTFKGNNSTNSSYDSCSGNLALSTTSPYISLDSNDKNYSTTLNVPEYLWLHNITVKYGDK